MKVLLLGSIYSMWTIHFVEEFLLKNHYEVWILGRSNAREDRKYNEFYKRKGVHFIDGVSAERMINDGKAGKNYFEILYGHFLQVKKIVKSGYFDIINLHYVDFPDLVYAALLKHILKGRVILSYWGSDLLRASDKKLKLMGAFVRCADFVTFDNKDLEIKFRKQYKWRRKTPLKTVLFGLPVLDIINDKCKKTELEDLRKKWKIPEGKTVIAIGYNGIPQQQHIEVLSTIERLEDKQKEKIFLLLQMTYGGTKIYRRQVIAAAEKTGCEYMAVQQFLTEEQVADLRIITDIFINAQTTDAFSGTVCENMYAGTLLLNAKWLCYQEFKEHDFHYLEFEDINDIGLLIETALEQKTDATKNKELVWQLRSWECCAREWRRVYHKVMNQQSKKCHRGKKC